MKEEETEIILRAIEAPRSDRSLNPGPGAERDAQSNSPGSQYGGFGQQRPALGVCHRPGYRCEGLVERADADEMVGTDECSNGPEK